MPFVDIHLGHNVEPHILEEAIEQILYSRITKTSVEFHPPQPNDNPNDDTDSTASPQTDQGPAGWFGIDTKNTPH